MYTITSLNTQSCADSLKRFKLFQYLKKIIRSDIYLLQDTHTVENVESLWRILWRGQIIFSHKSSSEAGLAILVHPRSNITFLSHCIIIPGRILYAKIQCDKMIIHVFNIYAPTSNNERKNFFIQFKAILDTYDFNNEPIFCSGDFNCTLNPKYDRTSKKEHHLSSARELDIIVDVHKLIDSHLYLNKNTIAYTWRNKTGSASRIDRIYVSDYFVTSMCKYKTAICPYSDHSSVQLSFVKQNSHSGSPYWKFNVDFLNDKEFQNTLIYFWKMWSNKKHMYGNLLLWWDIGKSKISQICQQYGRERSLKFKREKQQLSENIAFYEQNMNEHSAFLSSYNSSCKILKDLKDKEIKEAQIRSRF